MAYKQKKPQNIITTPYWIIVSYKKDKIWGYPYLSKATCYNEYQTQINKLRTKEGNEYMKKVDWVIEEHFYEHLENDNSETDKSFSSF